MRRIHTAFGSFLDPGFVSPEGPLGHLLGKVNLLWANAVLHVFYEPEVPFFCKHAARMLAPGGVFFGVRILPQCAHLAGQRRLCPCDKVNACML